LLCDYGFIEGKDFLVSKKRAMENYIPDTALNRLVPNASIKFGDWHNVKQICKTNPKSSLLGGSRVLEKHFQKLSFQDLKRSFYDGNEDEFLKIYSIVVRKIPK